MKYSRDERLTGNDEKNKSSMKGWASGISFCIFTKEIIVNIIREYQSHFRLKVSGSGGLWLWRSGFAFLWQYMPFGLEYFLKASIRNDAKISKQTYLNSLFPYNKTLP